MRTAQHIARMVAREEPEPLQESPAERASPTELRFCCLFKEHVTMVFGNKQTRAVCAESYREAAAQYEPCERCRTRVDDTQKECGNPFSSHLKPFRRKLQRVRRKLARRISALATCKYICVYCLLKAKRKLKKRKKDGRILEESKGKIKDKLQTMGLCKDDVRHGIIQIMKKPRVVLSKMQTNDHWKNNNGNHLSIKEVPQVENYDSSDDNDEISLCSYDGDEETNDYNELILTENNYKESYHSDSSLEVSKVESTSTNFNSASSSSLQVNLNIKQNLIASNILEVSDSQFSKSKIKLKKRHSLPPVSQQYNQAKRSRSHSDDSPKQETTSSLKLMLRKDHVSNQYRVSSPGDQLTVSENILRIVDIDSSEDSTNDSRNFTTDGPTFSENKSLVRKNTESIESISKLKVHIDKAVPELELNDTKPVNMPVNRNNLENSLSSFLKSKLKRNLKDDVEVESKRQKITDDSVAVKINVNITVNNVLEGSLQKQQLVELTSLNDNSKELLPKTKNNICSTSDFSSCNESDDESSVSQKMNSMISIPKNSYVKSLESKKNIEPVLSAHESLQVDHNCNIEKSILTTNKITLEKSKVNGKISKTKHQKNLTINGNLKLVFKNLFGEVSDASEAEEEILKQKRSQSTENHKGQSVKNSIVATVENNQSKNETIVQCPKKQNISKLKDSNLGSPKPSAIENIEEVNNGINKRAEISSTVSNVKLSVKLSEHQILISKFQNTNQNDLNTISSNKNIQKSIDEFGKDHDNKGTVSNGDKNIQDLIDVLEKNSDSEEEEEENSDVTEQINVQLKSGKTSNSHVSHKDIQNQMNESEKCLISKEVNSHVTNTNISKKSGQHKKSTNSEESNTGITDKNNPKQNSENEKIIESEKSNTKDADKNISEQSDQHEKRTRREEINTWITDQIISKQIDENEKRIGNEETNTHDADTHIDEREKSLSIVETNSLFTERNILKQIDQLKKICDIQETDSEKNIPKQISQLQKNCSEEKEDSHIDTNILKQTDEFESPSSSEETNSYSTDNFSSKDQVVSDRSQTYEQVDLEAGDFEFMTSIHKIKSTNEYYDDEYNDYSDFDGEYDGSNNVEYNSDVEFVESYKNPSNNKDLKTIVEEKSHAANNLEHQQDYKVHNLNKLPSFYNEDVRNFVSKDIIDVDDEDVVILNDFGAVSKAKNNSNFNAVKSVKSETVINLDSEEEVVEEIIEEIAFKEGNDELPNEVTSETRETVTNNTINNLNIEDANEIDQSLETNNEIRNAVEKTVTEKNLEVLECGLSSSSSKEAESVTMVQAEKGEHSKVSLDANQIPASSNTKVRNTSEVTVTQETVSINSFINQLIENALKPSKPNKNSATSDKSLTNFSENILNQNNESVSSNSLITDDSEDLDLSRSVSPNALVIDESVGTDDSNISDHLTSEIEKSVSNEIRNSECSENNFNSSKIDNTVPAVTSSVDELVLQHSSRFSGNVSNDLNNLNILHEFNLTKEFMAPEDIKNEPIMSDENDIEQQIRENLLEEFKNNASNLEDQSSVSIKVTEASEVVINQTGSKSIPSSNVIIEVTMENPVKSPEVFSDWMDIDNLSKIAPNTVGPFKCRDINELLEKPVTKETGTNAAEVSNLNVQVTTPLELPTTITSPIVISTTISSNSTQNTVPMQNFNSSSQLNQQNNLIFGSNLIQTNVPDPFYILPTPMNQFQGMTNQLSPLQECIPQQIQQPVVNVVNPTILPQYIPQTYIMTSVRNNQNLSQGNPQIFTSAVCNNTQNQNLPSANQQPFAPTTSNNVQKIFASSMFTNMFAQKSTCPSALSESQVPRSDANNSSAVPPEPDTIFSLPLPPSKDIILPTPLSITSQDTEISILNKVIMFRKILLMKIEIELCFVRTILQKNQEAYEAIIEKKFLTQNIWNFHLGILTIMKCLHAVYATTASKNYRIIMNAVTNSLKHFETPEMKAIANLEQLFNWNIQMGKSGYNFSSPKDCANVVAEELQAFQDPNTLRQPMTMKQKSQLRYQLQNYNKIYKTNQKEVNSLRSKYNVGNQNVYQNNYVTNRPVIGSVNATISNNPSSRKSLQKSSLNDTKTKPPATSNVTVQKIIDKSQTNNTEISITPVGSDKKEANSESVLINLNHTCLKCKKTSEIACSNCLSVAYCSRECQYNHWKEIHYKNCEKHQGTKFL